MHIVLTNIKNIDTNDPLLDITLMKDSSTKVLFWLYVPSSRILSNPVAEKKRKINGRKRCTCKDSCLCWSYVYDIKRFFEKNEALRKDMIQSE